MKTITILFIFIFCLGKSVQSQTLATVDAMEHAKKSCVEANEPGRSPISCIGRFKDQLDSLMLVVYQKLNDRASLSYQQVLRKEQADWLEKRLTSDSTIEATAKEGMSAAALRIYKYDSKTEFLRDRVKYLISKL